ncbi:SusC/RagA family TonB-linked outer membrane protein [Sphingobacterium paludis]|nr:SusC/RagA family TonB-linked outer membrane protein [Sphingobacterium paludis]
MAGFFSCLGHLMADGSAGVGNRPGAIINSSYLRVQVEITGRVLDQDGAPVKGATLTAVGTSNSVSTDEFGRYKLIAPKDAVLEVSAVGYKTSSVAIEGRTIVDITISSAVHELDDVVIVGYGSRRRKDVTGAIASPDLNLQKEAPNGNVMSSLRGTTPGLNIGQTTRAGENPAISIRGTNSINGSTAPLIVVDGMIYRGSLSSINPNDIASIDLLKDASAAAVYGSQSTNGVIIVTTKSGTVGGERVSIDYSGGFSIQEMTNKHMIPLDGPGFMKKVGDWFLDESRLASDRTMLDPEWDPGLKFDPIIQENYRNGHEAGWWNLLTNPNPRIHTHNLSISGNTPQSRYFLSYGYFDQNNLIKEDKYKRHTLRLNLESKILPWITVGGQTSFTANDFSGNPPSFADIVQLNPYNLPFDPQTGDQLEVYKNTTVPTILEVMRRNRNQDLNKNFVGNFFATVNIPKVEGLNYRINFGNNYTEYKEFNYERTEPLGKAFNSHAYDYYLTLDNILTYNRRFGKHGIDATLLYGMERNSNFGTRTNAEGIENDVLGFNRLDAGNPALLTVVNTGWREQMLYQMARLSYNFDDRYIFTGTIRRDGFSGFSELSKTAVFPVAAVAWRISQEGFLKSNRVIDDLKLRISYGTTGNRTVGRYATLSQLTSTIQEGYHFGDGAAPQIGSFISTMANTSLRWERTTSFNVGLDFALLENRISGSFELYNSKTRDLLNERELPTVTGFSSISINTGLIENTGQELSITGIPIQTENFTWRISANLFRNRNKIVDPDGTGNDVLKPDQTQSLIVGQPLGVVRDYRILGIYQEADVIPQSLIDQGFRAGQYQLEDVNGDGRITADDLQILGRLDPSYSFGVGNDFKYKNLEFKFFINSIQGGKNSYLGTPGMLLRNPDNSRFNNSFDFDYWTPENPDATYRAINYYTPAYGAYAENFHPYQSRSFIRLQDVTLTYRLPESWAGRAKLANASVFVNAQNLLTWTKWDGWDPESNQFDSSSEQAVTRSIDRGSFGSSTGRTPIGVGLDLNGSPVMKTYSFGINVSF